MITTHVETCIKQARTHTTSRYVPPAHPDNSQVLAREAGTLVGKLEFEQTDTEMVILHTYAYQSGRGIGSLLMEAALQYAAQQHLTIRPVCSFAAKYMETKIKKQ